MKQVRDQWDDEYEQVRDSDLYDVRDRGRLAKTAYAVMAVVMAASVLWVLDRAAARDAFDGSETSTARSEPAANPDTADPLYPSIDDLLASAERESPPVDRASANADEVPEETTTTKAPEPPAPARPTPPPPVRLPLESPASQRVFVPPPQSEPKAPAQPPLLAAAAPPPTPRRAVEDEALVLPPAPPPEPAPAPVTPPVRPSPVLVESAPPAAAAPSSVRAVAPAVDVDRSAIRDVLGRYRTAFNKLDAGAARQVWPTVNERTLTKAFEQLEEQNVSFDDCTIGVTGGRAEANCRGTTRFVPRVGSRSAQTEPRQWSFSLRKGTAGWLIQEVQAR